MTCARVRNYPLAGIYLKTYYPAQGRTTYEVTPMAGFEINAERAVVSGNDKQSSLSGAQAEGYSVSQPIKVAEQSPTAAFLPRIVVCPDGTATIATTRAQATQIHLGCRDKS